MDSSDTLMPLTEEDMLNPFKSQPEDRLEKFRIQAKNWFLTWPQTDYELEEVAAMLQEKCKNIQYMCICKENHHKTDGVHHHALVMLNNQLNCKNCTFWDLENHHCHVEAARSPKRTLDYIRKDGHVLEFGECPFKAKMTVRQINELVKDGKLKELVDIGQISIYSLPSYCKGLDLYNRLKETRKPVPEVHWFYGPTGSGKTRTAVEESEGKDTWISSDGKWFDGYHGQDVAILDEVRTGTYSFPFLLRLLDRYELSVPVKGGFARWIPSHIYITAPVRPEDMFVNHETQEPWDHLDQLIRRITEFREFRQNN